MDYSKESAMIALLPITTDWCKIECPHMTLVYAGNINDLGPGTFNQLAKDAASLAMLSSRLYLGVSGVAVFGEDTMENPKVNVLTLQPNSELLAMRAMVEHWNQSKFPFKPHCTIGPASDMVPQVPPSLAFDRLMVGYGEDQLTFRLKS